MLEAILKVDCFVNSREKFKRHIETHQNWSFKVVGVSQKETRRELHIKIIDDYLNMDMCPTLKYTFGGLPKGSLLV